MELVDIHHVSLNVTDVVKAKAFYVDLLGMTVLPRPDFGVDGAWLEVGTGRQVHLIAAETVAPDVGHHFAFSVADIDAAVAELSAADVDVRGPFEIGTGARQVFFHDPDGNRVEINQPPTTS